MANDNMMGILIDYEYCSGCQACEMACQVEHGFPKGEQGVVVATVGPWPISGKPDTYQYDYFPLFTDACSLCAERTAKGKKPTCVKHCLAACLEYDKASVLAEKAVGKAKQILFIPKAGDIA